MDSTGIGAPIGVGRNARVAHIRKFVCVPPERGAVLRLVAVEDPPTTLGEWPRTACVDNAATAEDADALLRDHADTSGRETIANLAWQSTEGHVVCTKRLKCKPDSPQDPGSMAQAEAAGLDGSKRAEDIQRQREHEAAMRCYFSAHQTQSAQGLAMMREQREMITCLGTMLREQYVATNQAQIAQDKLREHQRRELKAAQLAVQEASESAATESGASSEVLTMAKDLLSQAMPLIFAAVQRHMMLAQPANTNAAQPTASAAE